jgi:prostaglandin-E synthase
MAGSAGGTWNLKFDFFGEVDPAKSKWSVGTRDVSFVFMRKSAGSFWDKLNKGAKLTTLKCDWDKWKDEDDDQVCMLQLS